MIGLCIARESQGVRNRHASADGSVADSRCYRKVFLNAQNKNPASTIDAGNVRTQAIKRLRTVAH